jgi:predicted transcriptional regulator
MANTPQFTMRLDPELRKALEEIATRENRTLSNLIELICRRYVEADRKPRKK